MVEEYNEKWYSIFEKEEEDRDYWLESIDRYLYAFLQIISRKKEYEVKSVDKKRYMKMEKLFDSYKHFLKVYLNDNKSQLINDIYTSANRFREIFDPVVIDKKIEKDDMLQRVNGLIYGLNQETIIPFVFYIELTVENDDDKKVLYKTLETFIIRRVVTRKSSKNYNNLFQDTLISNEINTGKKLEDYIKKSNIEDGFPSYEDMLYAVSNMRLNNKDAKYVLYLIEIELRNTMISTDVLGFSKYSLEHLMHKKWRTYWVDIEPSGELAEHRDKVFLTLGNLAIISGPLNSSISNSEWSVKLNGKGKKDGLKKLGSGIVTHEDVIDKKVWDESYIKQRAENLFKWISMYWPIISE